MNQRREHWSSQIGFILSSAGSAIGLGSLWRFPFVAGENGGGAFVFLYLFFTLILSLPIFMGALAIGRMTQQSAVSAYGELGHQSSWRAVGWLNILTCFIILSFYCVVSGWCLNYALMSLNEFTKGRTPEEIQNVFNLVYSSADMNLFWLFITMLLNVGVVISGVRKGIERWSKILMPLLFILLIGLFIFSLFLPGFPKAVQFIFYPEFSKLTPTVILNALGMALFTLSVGLGINITYGSYLRESESIPKTALIITSMTVLISLIASMMIFPIVFTYNFPPQGGPGLIFKTMPVLFSKMPINLLLSTLFFLLVVFAAITSSIAMLEVIVSNLMEVFDWKRRKAVWLTSIGIFLFGIPSALAGSKVLFPLWETIYGKNFFNTLDNVTANWMMPIGALLSTIFLGWVIKKETLLQEYQKGSKYKWPLSLSYFFLKFVAPLAIVLTILKETGVFS